MSDDKKDYKKKEIWLDYYTGEDCIHCGRNRVEQSNIRRVCEKCRTDQDTGKIAYDFYMEVI